MGTRRKGLNIADLRKHLHCSQKDLAGFLQTAQSSIARAEKGVKPLPVGALEPYHQLVKTTMDAIATVLQPVPAPAESVTEARRSLKRSIRIRKFELYKLEKNLGEMIALYSEVINTGAVLQAMPDHFKGKSRSKFNQLLIVLKQANKVRRNTCDLSKLNTLRAQSAGKRAEIAELERLLSEIPG